MRDFRLRNLIVLGALAALSLVLAAATLIIQARESRGSFTPGEFLPGFATQVKDATRIHIVSHDGAFDVVYLPDKGWVLPARGNYPADFDQVRHTLIGLAALETIAPKTSRADWLSYIGLDTPPKGDGIEITVSDKSGKTIASLIAGNAASAEDVPDGSGMFVRHPGDNQSYLVRSVFTPKGKVADWLETGVMTVEPARLNTVTITPVGGAPFTVAREQTSDKEYKLLGPPPPKGFVINRVSVNLIPQLITDFAFADVEPASRLDFSKAAHLAARTFDGQNIVLDAVSADGAVWVRVSAKPDPGTPTMQRQEAGMINARAAGWAYKLSPDKGRLLMMKRDDLFTKADPGGPAGSPFGAPN
jgi:hypothetical protein